MILLTDEEFNYIYKFVYDQYGINLEKKRNLIQSRLQSTLSDNNLTSFKDYFKMLRTNPDEITNFLNNITTNHTIFFREQDHFDLLKQQILPEITDNGKILNFNIWSAGCSSGEEVFSIIMTIYNYLGINSSRWTQKLLATDISRRVMDKAQHGVYTEENLKNISKDNLRKFFMQIPNTDTYKLKSDVIGKVSFQYFNLMSAFPYRNKFDVIFCRNVMIYFDNPTREKLLAKFYNALKPGGYFIIGHSETVNGVKNDFKYLKPSVYRKEV